MHGTCGMGEKGNLGQIRCVTLPSIIIFIIIEIFTMCYYRFSFSEDFVLIFFYFWGWVGNCSDKFSK